MLSKCIRSNSNINFLLFKNLWINDQNKEYAFINKIVQKEIKRKNIPNYKKFDSTKNKFLCYYKNISVYDMPLDNYNDYNIFDNHFNVNYNFNMNLNDNVLRNSFIFLNSEDVSLLLN